MIFLTFRDPPGGGGLKGQALPRFSQMRQTKSLQRPAGKRKPRNARAVSVMDGILGWVMAGAPLLPGHAAPLNATEPPDGTARANSFRPLTGRMRVGTVVRDHQDALFGPLRRYALSCPSCLVSIFINSASMCRQRR